MQHVHTHIVSRVIANLSYTGIPCTTSSFSGSRFVVSLGNQARIRERVGRVEVIVYVQEVVTKVKETLR